MPGDEVQVDQAEIFVDAHHALVQPHCPQRHKAGSVADIICRCVNILCGDTANGGGFFHAALHHGVFVPVEAISVRCNKGAVGMPVGDKHTANGMVQHNVGAGVHLQVQVGHGAALRYPRVAHNDLQAGIGCPGCFHAAPEYRVAPGGVSAGHENAVRLLYVVVGARHGIFSQSHFIGGYRAAHAQARVGIYVITAYKSFDQFVHYIIFFRKALPGCVKGHRIRTVFFNDGSKYGSGPFQRLVP